MRSFLLAGSILCLAACSGSSLDVAPADGGDDSTNGDAIADSGGSDSGGGDTTVGDSTSGDTTPSDSISADTNPVPDARPDVVGDSGGGPCGAGSVCPSFLQCCSGACVYEQNDPLNCGGCGIVCSGDKSMCEGGHCVAPTCSPSCSAGQTCCLIDGPGPSGPPKCVDGPTCPIGCPACG